MRGCHNAAGLPLPSKHEALLAEMLFAQMLCVPQPPLKPLAYSTLMVRPQNKVLLPPREEVIALQIQSCMHGVEMSCHLMCAGVCCNMQFSVLDLSPTAMLARSDPTTCGRPKVCAHALTAA